MKELKAFKVLCDETRMRIINLLLKDEHCVCEIMQALDIPQSKASRGLIALHDSGFLKMRREGLWSLYSLDEESIKGFRSRLIEAVGEVLKDKEIAMLDEERLKKARRVGARCIGASNEGKSLKAGIG